MLIFLVGSYTGYRVFKKKNVDIFKIATCFQNFIISRHFHYVYEICFCRYKHLKSATRAVQTLNDVFLIK